MNRPFDVGVLVFDVEVDDTGLARRAPPSVGGGLKAPKEGHRRLPNFGKAFGAIYASAVCTDGCTDRWRSRVG